MKYVAVVLAALVLILGMQSLGRAEPPTGVQRWEYKQCAVINTGDMTLFDALFPEAKGNQTAALERLSELGIEVVGADQFKKFLTDAGAEGWELVSADDKHWIFKRPLK